MDGMARGQKGVKNFGKKRTPSVTQKFPRCPMTQYEVMQEEGRNFAGCRCLQCRSFCIAGEVVDSDNNPAIAS